MKLNRSSMQRGRVLWILAILIGIAMVGVAAAESDMMDTCRQAAAGSGNAGYYCDGTTGSGSARMMESVEIGEMGQPVHDEMKGLVARMISGNLSTGDRDRMIEIMGRHPGASNLMVTRMTAGNMQGWNGYGMMGGGRVYGGAGMMDGYGYPAGAGMNTGLMWICAIMGFLFFIVWLIVGILAILWFAKQLQKDKPAS